MKTKIAFVTFLLFNLSLLSTAFADEKHPLCQEVSKDIHLAINQPVAEIELRPTCWSSLVVVADYVEAISISYTGKGNMKFSFPAGVTFDNDGTAAVIMVNNKFRILGNGKITIKIVHSSGVEI